MREKDLNPYCIKITFQVDFNSFIFSDINQKKITAKSHYDQNFHSNKTDYHPYQFELTIFRPKQN